ncbi:hypothetical protein DITRI_Ditri06bG0159700 [Diplodiscus trichospermus]
MEKQDLEEVLLTRSFLLKSGECIRCNSSSIVELQDQGSSSGITFTVVFSTLIAACGSYVFGHAVGYSSPAQSGIMKELGLTTAEYSVFSSILSIGAMLGAVLSGRIADLIGRRAAMGIAQIFCLSGWLCIAFSEAAWLLDLGRFLLGYGMGLISFAVPIYIAEITPKDVRGGFTALNPLLMGFGQSLAFLIGSLVNWRILALIGIIPGLIQLPGLFFIPESPRWLVKVGRGKEFDAALRRLRGADADISEEATEIKEYTFFLQQIKEDGILNLFQRKYMLLLTVGVGLMAFQRFGGLYAFLFYASSIFESADSGHSIRSIACRQMWKTPSATDIFCGIVRGLYPHRIGIPFSGPSFWKGFVWHSGVSWCIVLLGFSATWPGRNTMDHNVRDISHKHKGRSRKPGDSG